MASDRWYVPDLTPQQREELRELKPRFVFVAESPHIQEVTPVALEERRPLCGSAGKAWWGMLTEIFEGHKSSDLSLEALIATCLKENIAVMNAVQKPLDPKIAAQFPEADPLETLGFAKTTGERSYKKMKASPEVRKAVADLASRLSHPSLKNTPVVCLGNDAEWFLTQALGGDGYKERVIEKIPHPSAWWRSGGLYERVAREKLERLFMRKNRRLA